MTASTITVRPARADEVDAVARLEAGQPGRDAWSAGLVREGSAGSGCRRSRVSLSPRSGGELVGHAVTSSAGDIAELQRIAVDGVPPPAGRGRLPCSGRWSRLRVVRLRTGCSSRCARTTEARSGFYAGQGFVEIDRRPRCCSDGATAVVMRAGAGAWGVGGRAEPL